MGALYPLILLTYLLIWDWRFGLIAVAILPGYAYYYAASQKILTRASRPTKERLSRQTSVFLDLVQGATEIRIFHQEEASRRRFVAASDAYTGAATTSRRRYDASRTWMDMIGITVTYSPVLIGGFLILGGSDGLTAGMLLACMTHLRLLTMRLTLIFYGMAGLAIMAPSLKRIAEVLDCPAPPSPPLLDTAEAPDEFSLEFQNLCFHHEDGRVVFSNLGLTIAQGEKVAIMGPSGSGKSTLLQLLLRLRKPSGGRILLGGKDIENYPLPFYLSFFSYVGQKNHLFHLSVRENISMGWYNVPDALIREAVTRVRMHDAVMRLPAGYDTVLGESGVDLSGGQNQRMALARALIRDPAILILDEFTSAMDRQVEEDILDDLFAISEGRSLVCVTHSDAVARRFDRIVHLDVLQGSTGIRS
jgi:ATP-binding cassette subfamily B protein